MLINDIVPVHRYVYTGNDTFPITFPFYGELSVRCYVSKPDDLLNYTSLQLGVDFTLETIPSGDKNEFESARAFKGAELTIISTEDIEIGDFIVIHRDTIQEQLYRYNELDSFPAKSHENALGKLMTAVQEISEELSRTIRSSIMDPNPPESAEDLIQRFRDIEAEAQAILDEIRLLTQPMILAKGVKNARGTWITDRPITSGSLLRLPVVYFPGRNMLHLTMDGLTCYPYRPNERAGIHQFKEVGLEDEPSQDVIIMFDTEDVCHWSAWSIASNVSQALDEQLALAQKAATDAITAAQKAEDIQGNVEVAIGNAAEIAAEQAAKLAVEKAEALMSSMVETAQEIKEAIDKARDDALLASDSADASAVLAGGHLDAILNLKTNLEALESNLNSSISSAKEDLKEASRLSNEVKEMAMRAEQAAANAASEATKGVEAKVVSFMDEMREVVSQMDVTVSGVALHSLAGQRPEVIPAETEIEIAEYKVGSGALQVFWNGLYCIPGDDASVAQYMEIGTDEEISTHIIFHDDVPVDCDLSIIVNTVKKGA